MNINYLVDQNQIIIAVIIALGIMAIAIGVILIFTSSVRTKKMVKDIENKFEEVHNELTVRLYQDLKRIGTISKLNVEYEQIYESNMNLYRDISRHEDAIAKQAVRDLNELLLDKKYKLIKIEIEQVKVAISNLQDKIKILSNSIGAVVDVDNENQRIISEHRRLYHEVRETYESKKGELKYIDESFEKVFSKVENVFIDAEKLLSAAKYEEARANFPEIEKVLLALKKQLETLPKLVTSTYIVIPTTIKELLERHDKMVKEGYPLHHLRVINHVDNFNKTLEELKDKLLKFNIKNVDQELLNIREQIIKLNNDIDDEEAAKIYFKQNYTKIYNDSYQVSNRFLKLRRNVPNYKEAYLIRDVYLDTVTKIQNDISDLDRIKRMVDTFVHSPNPQPFTTLATRLKDLESATVSINSKIDEMQGYLSSLKKKTEGAYNYIIDTYQALKTEESNVRKIDVPEFSKIVNRDFSIAYNLLNRGCEIVKTTPIDVDTLIDVVSQAKNAVNNLFEKTKDIENTVNIAEELVVRANVYRTFLDVQNDMDVVERAFFEGDFTRTIDEAGKIVKKFKSQLDE